MSNNALLFREFDKFAQLETVDKETLTEDDVDLFLNKFLSPRSVLFYHKGLQLLCANAVDRETGEKPYNMEGKSYVEAVNELKPILSKKVKDSYGSISKEANAFGWDPTPKTVKEIAISSAYDAGLNAKKWHSMTEMERIQHPVYANAQIEANKIQSRLAQYHKKVLPFMLRKTMHHPISFIEFSQTRGYIPTPIRDTKDVNEVTLHSEDDLLEMVSSTKYKDTGVSGAKNSEIRGIVWDPFPSRKDLKLAVIDIDNPAKLKKEKLRDITHKAATRIADAGHPYIIMYTGKNFQIWLGQNNQQPLGDAPDVIDYLRALLNGLGNFQGKQEAIDANEIWFDERILSDRRIPTRMFFSLHYPLRNEDKSYSGLAAVPVQIDNIKTFDPYKNAHPDIVLANFDRYASLVSAFFDEVEVGQDFGIDTETDPECTRLPEKYPNHELVSLIDSKSNTIGVKLEDVSSKLADEESAFVYVKARGIDAVITYNERGGIRFGGNTLTSAKIKSVGLKKEASSENALSAIITRTGIVIHHDHISRDLQRYCQAKNISQITLVGQLVSVDYLGNELEEQEIRGVISRKEAILPDEFKLLKFVVNKIATHNHDMVPLETMGEAVGELTTNRILSGPNNYYTKPIDKKVETFYRTIRNQYLGRELVILGEEKYLVSSAQTMKMVVLGIDPQTRAHQQNSREIGNVYVGVIKTDRNRGPVYYIMAKAEIALKKEDRIKLKELTYGEDNANILPTNLVNKERTHADAFQVDILVAEPSIVVEVAYDDIVRRMTTALPFHFLPGTMAGRPVIYRALPVNRYITKMIGAKIIAIREDLSPLKQADASFDQDNLVKIRASAPKGGFTIVQSLPNPIKRDDISYAYDKYLGEEIDTKLPWKMSEKAFDKFSKLTKNAALIGYVDGKRMYYNEADHWVMPGNNEDFFWASMTFRSIKSPFKLRGIDIMTATKMCAEYGINWHLVVSENTFYWMYCNIENDEIRKKHAKYIRDEDYDGDIEEVLSDLLHTVNSAYAPKEVVKDAKVPGFVFDVTVVEKIKQNPAFYGVPKNLNSWMDVYIDAEELGLDEDGNQKYRYVEAGGTIVPMPTYGGRAVDVPLIGGTTKIPGEFNKAAERFDKGQEGYKVYIDSTTANSMAHTPHYTVTDLPFYFSTAVDDVYGYGQDGNRVLFGKNTDKLSQITDSSGTKSFKTQIDNHDLVNKEQAKEDAKIFTSMFNYVPGGKVIDKDQEEEGTYTGLSKVYIDAYKKDGGRLQGALTPTPFTHFRARINPPIKEEAWAHYVGKYVNTHASWDSEPEPKESWERYSIGEYPIHLVEMLEKERLLLKAQSEHSLTEDELRIVNETFSAETTGDLLESALSDLFEATDEEDDEEEEVEYEPNDEDYDID
jgi:hypothetical protein